MNFYVASSFQNTNLVNVVQEKLTELGHSCTYDWTTNGRAKSLAELREIGLKEKEAVLAADVVIILLPAGKGSHIELGIAIGSQKRIYLYCADERLNNSDTTSTFYHLEEVKQVVGSIEELVSRVMEDTQIEGGRL